MSRGNSGRIVLEVDTILKRSLYAELAREGATLKEWFIAQAERYIAERQQPALLKTTAELKD